MRTLTLLALLFHTIFSSRVVEAQQPTEPGINFLATVLKINDSDSVIQVLTEPTGRNAVVNLGKSAEVFSSMGADCETLPFGKSNPVNPKSSIVGKRVWINASANAKSPSQYDARFVVQTETSGKEIQEAQSVIKYLVKSDAAIAEEFYARLYLCGRVIDRATKLGLGNNPHILLGRINFSGKENPRSICSQLQVMDKGYFVTTCLDSKIPISIDLHGFMPNELLAKSSEPAVENLGTVELLRVTRKESSYVSFRLPKAVEAEWKDRPISVYTVPRSFNTAGIARVFSDSPSNVVTRSDKNGLYKSVPLSPGLKYHVYLSIGGKSYGSVFTLKPGETRELGELQEISKEVVQPKISPVVPSSPPESESQRLDRQYEAKIVNFKIFLPFLTQL